MAEDNAPLGHSNNNYSFTWTLKGCLRFGPKLCGCGKQGKAITFFFFFIKRHSSQPQNKKHEDQTSTIPGKEDNFRKMAEREPSQNKYGGGHKRNGNNLEIYVTEENKKESMECEEFV